MSFVVFLVLSGPTPASVTHTIKMPAMTSGGVAKASLNADYARTEISRWQARSMAISTSGIVAAESPLAAQAVRSCLRAGGTRSTRRLPPTP